MDGGGGVVATGHCQLRGEEDFLEESENVERETICSDQQFHPH